VDDTAASLTAPGVSFQRREALPSTGLRALYVSAFRPVNP
jgi:hypothetical protein